jgi:hypothetical protein
MASLRYPGGNQGGATMNFDGEYVVAERNNKSLQLYACFEHGETDYDQATKELAQTLPIAVIKRLSDKVED